MENGQKTWKLHKKRILKWSTDIKRSSKSLVTRGMHIKITVLNHYIPTRLAQIKKNDILNVKDGESTNC